MKYPTIYHMSRVAAAEHRGSSPCVLVSILLNHHAAHPPREKAARHTARHKLIGLSNNKFAGVNLGKRAAS